MNFDRYMKRRSMRLSDSEIAITSELVARLKAICTVENAQEIAAKIGVNRVTLVNWVFEGVQPSKETYKKLVVFFAEK